MGCFDGTAQFWDLKSCKPLGWPLEHERPVYRAQFCSDGTEAVTLTEANEGRISIWKVPTPIEAEVNNLFRWIEAVGGLQLLEDGTVRLIDVPTWDKLRSQLKKALGGAEVIPLELSSVP